MSSLDIGALFETELASMSPPIDPAWENVDFTPTAGRPYQVGALMLGQPINDEMTSGFIEQGLYQVTLRYPKGKGAGAAQTRAEAVRSLFPRGRTLTNANTTVQVWATPEIMPAYIDADRYAVPVRIRFRSVNPAT